MVALGGIINLITCSIAGTTRSTFFVGRTGWQEEPKREGHYASSFVHTSFPSHAKPHAAWCVVTNPPAPTNRKGTSQGVSSIKQVLPTATL